MKAFIHISSPSTFALRLTSSLKTSSARSVTRIRDNLTCTDDSLRDKGAASVSTLSSMRSDYRRRSRLPSHGRSQSDLGHDDPRLDRDTNTHGIGLNSPSQTTDSHPPILGSTGMHSTVLPIIRKQLEDNTEEDIPEEELYRYTRHRWLTFDEDKKLASRYCKFDIAALSKAAVNAVDCGAKSCVKILKCIEGSYNKALILTLDNGIEVLAKLPNPNAGPSFYTTASQVATHGFIRDILKLPVPPIYTYSAESTNAVGAEYIIEGKATGKPLSSVWYGWPEESQMKFLSQLVEMETKLASLSFRSHGSLYYKKDLLQKDVSVRDFQTPLLHPSSKTFNHTSLREYAIGPSTMAALWAGERAAMNGLDRGPWSTPLAYMASIGTNERKWAQAHAVPQSNPYNPTGEAQSPEGYISLLDRYLQLIPHMAPPPTPTMLSHPDLHLDNIFVDPDTMEITCIIDWQSTLVSEPYFQRSYPQMLILVESRARDDDETDTIGLSPDVNDFLKRLPRLRNHYKTLIEERNPQQWGLKHDLNCYFLTEVVSSIPGSWIQENGFRLCHNLVAATADWEKIAPAGMPCPFHFANEELSVHKRDLKVVADLAQVLDQLEQGGIIPNAGKVLPDDYERALDASRSVKEWFVSRMKTEKAQHLNSRVWPYRT
ncbi:hypothetical protein Vi05172_g5260 [Venturia inaequalis]|nr:hypothetical protein Vi05172_g5260 [Venturia inaequalis]